MSNNFYSKLFASRSVISFFMVLLLLLSCVLRVAVISTGNYKEKQIEQSTYKIDIAYLRGTVFDCNMLPITNNNTKNVAAVLPTKNAIAKISKYIDDDSLNNLKNDTPIICTLQKSIKATGINTTLVYETTDSNDIANHIIGYTDSSGHGVSGLQLAYDQLLYSDKKISAVFSIDGKGNVLCGVEPYFENDLSVVNSGVVTTLDINIQRIAEKAALKLNSGCVIVADANNSKIRAMVSVPDYDIKNIADNLNDKNSPMLNRALSLYSIGSVFKPCVAAQIIECGFLNKTFNCLGSLKIDERSFRCHKLDGHGMMDLCNSLAQSCNCFFYDASILLGAEKIYNIASRLSLGAKFLIADNIYTANGNLPPPNTLNSNSDIANLSIGQGSLMTSPVAMLNLYASIAGDGGYYLPSIVEKTINGGVTEEYNIGYKTKVMEASTAKKLREYLKTVVTDGTGTEANPILCTAAGKTATAQTGRYYENGTEITNSWFCGFFPDDEPEYTVVVMSDSKSNVSTASVFAEIADGITDLINNT